MKTLYETRTEGAQTAWTYIYTHTIQNIRANFLDQESMMQLQAWSATLMAVVASWGQEMFRM